MLIGTSSLPGKLVTLAVFRGTSRAVTSQAHYSSALRRLPLFPLSHQDSFRHKNTIVTTNKMASSSFSSSNTGIEDGTTGHGDHDKKLSVGILLFPNVEVLDFAGPFEVFSRTRTEAGPASRRTDDKAPFKVFTVSQDGPEKTLLATGNLQVTADYSLAAAPDIDILVIPGGFGTRLLLDHEPTLDWIKNRAASAQLVTSVCTGALLLAKAGLLDGKRATTHWAALDVLEEETKVTVDRKLRWVEDGNVVTSAGVAAGVDMAFHIVERVCGKEVADETAHYIEYPRHAADSPRSSV